MTLIFGLRRTPGRWYVSTKILNDVSHPHFVNFFNGIEELWLREEIWVDKTQRQSRSYGFLFQAYYTSSAYYIYSECYAYSAYYTYSVKHNIVQKCHLLSLLLIQGVHFSLNKATLSKKSFDVFQNPPSARYFSMTSSLTSVAVNPKTQKCKMSIWCSANQR